MPTKPFQPCRQPGCAALVPRGYCDAHAKAAPKRAYDQTTRRNDPALAEAARIRNSSLWQQVRAMHRAQHPLCCDPFKEHGRFPVPMTQVHHIQGVAVAPHLAYDPSNLASLCDGCHHRIEALERAGKGTAEHFAEWVNSPK